MGTPQAYYGPGGPNPYGPSTPTGFFGGLPQDNTTGGMINSLPPQNSSLAIGLQLDRSNNTLQLNQTYQSPFPNLAPQTDPRQLTIQWRWSEGQGGEFSGQIRSTFDTGVRCDVNRSPRTQDPSNWNISIENVENSKDKLQMLMKGSGYDVGTTDQCVTKSQFTFAILKGGQRGAPRMVMWVYNVRVLCACLKTPLGS